MPNTEIIFRNLRTLTPEARIAVTSLSAAMRLSPSRIPTSTPMGMVTFSAAGRVRKKDFRHAGERSAVAHHGLKNAREFAHENNESED